MKQSIYLLFLILFASSNFAYSQNRNSIWCFGDSAGLDFKTSIPTPIHTAVKSRGSCVSISNTAGNLLFYSFTRAGLPGNTTRVYNYLDSLVENGDSLNGEGWYNELVIATIPGDTNQYYLFHQNAAEPWGLHYSVIDMSENGGLGKVVQKNIQIMPNPMQFTDCLTAIKHGNGRDWWVICRKTNILPNDSIYTFLVDPQGVHGPYTQLFGANNPDGFNRTCFNSDGTKMYWSVRGGDLHQYDFDRCTGLFSNKIILRSLNPNDVEYFWSMALSPNERYLYITTNLYCSILYQLDLLNANPWGNRIMLDTIPTPYPDAGAFLRLAPDNKIYLSCWYVDTNLVFPYPYTDTCYNMYNMNLSVINQPDSPGAACNFTPFSFYLGGNRTYIGLPNNPNYEIGPLVGSGCDTLTSVGNVQLANSKNELKVFYHSGWQKAFINAHHLKGTAYMLSVTDVMGRLVFKEKGKLLPPYFTKDLDCGGFAKGMYIVCLQTEREVLSMKFIKE